MSAPVSESAAVAASPAERLRDFLRAELAPFPGRFRAMVRQLVCLGLVMIISLTLDIPFLMLSIIIVFFCHQMNLALTVLAGVVITVGCLFTNVMSIMMLAWTFEYALARILTASAIIFVGLYCLRINPLLGAIGYMSALVAVFDQSLYPLAPYPEFLLRATLWCVAAGLYPVLVVIVVNTLILPVNPVKDFERELRLRVDGIWARIEAGPGGSSLPPVEPDREEAAGKALRRNLAFAGILNKTYKAEKARYLRLLDHLDRLSAAARRLSEEAAGEADPDRRTVLADLLEGGRAFRRSLDQAEPFRLAPEAASALTTDLERLRRRPGALPAEVELGEAFLDLAGLADQPFAPEAKKPFLIPDAWINPAYARFAFKSTLATMLCYFFYSSVQWDGVHTSMLTCIILAQPSVGESAQKAVLRLGGCATGSLVTLLIVIFVVPHLESLAGILVVTLVFMAGASWVAMGSPRISYAGMQIAFAYTLALLENYGPNFNLVEIRDRLMGIVIGIVVYTVIGLLLWPEHPDPGAPAPEGLGF